MSVVRNNCRESAIKMTEELKAREDGQPRDEPLPGAPPALAAGGTCGEGAVILGPGTGHQAEEDQRGA